MMKNTGNKKREIAKIIQTQIKQINQIKEFLLFKEKQKKTILSIVKNSIYFKNLSFKKNIILNSKIHNLNSSSSSIIKHPNLENKFILLVRLVNYHLESNGNSVNYNDYNLSCNILITLDNYFNNIIEKMLDTKVEINSQYNGIEDVRLFNFNNEIYFIGSTFNITDNKIMIVSNKLNLHDDCFQKTYITPSFDTTFFWEKNWVFFENNDKLNIIYKWFPVYICEINYETQNLNLVKKVDNIPSFFNKFRGSTNGVLFDNKLWFIVHFRRNVFEKNMYLHVFIVFDKNMNLLGFSNPFNFENNFVEYCIGLTINKDNFVITYSTLDQTTKLCVFNYNYIKNIITEYNN